MRQGRDAGALLGSRGRRPAHLHGLRALAKTKTRATKRARCEVGDRDGNQGLQDQRQARRSAYRDAGRGVSPIEDHAPGDPVLNRPLFLHKRRKSGHCGSPSRADFVAKGFCSSKRARLSQDQAPTSNGESKIHSSRFDCCVFLFYSFRASTFATNYRTPRAAAPSIRHSSFMPCVRR